MTGSIWLWFAATVLAAVVWGSRHLQISRAASKLSPLHDRMYERDGHGLPPLSMLVAAKDEEANLGTCLRSLLAQDYPNLQLIAVNDRSADRTGEIIDDLARQDERLTAVHVRELRPGWFGKNNAMREGLGRARADWLCFTDADCEFASPRMLTIAMRFALEHQADFLSVLPVHQAHGFWERLIQPACSGILMIWFNPMKVNDPTKPAAYANGAFMLMRRSCYEAIGGHEVVKTQVNEDIHLARLAKQTGQRLMVVSNSNLYSVRMYSTFGQIWSGWSRIFYGCFGAIRRLLLSIATVTVFGLLPLVALIASSVALLGSGSAPAAWQALFVASVAAYALEATVMMRFYALNNSRAAYGLIYPVGAALAIGMLGNAIRRVGGRSPVTWRGTTYRGDRVADATSRQSGVS